MKSLSNSQKSRAAIKRFKVIADVLMQHGHYQPNDELGTSLENALREIKPEIYGSMNDRSVTELFGLQYVLERLPQGIETSNRIILTTNDNLDDTLFKKIIPPKRRRLSYNISTDETIFST